MTFKSYCYEAWLISCDECMSFNMETQPYKEWFGENRWFLRKLYRLQHGRLQKEWTPDYERSVSANQ